MATEHDSMNAPAPVSPAAAPGGRVSESGANDAAACEAARRARQQAIEGAHYTLDRIVDGEKQAREDILAAARVLPHRTVQVAGHLLEPHELAWLAERFPTAALASPHRNRLAPESLEACARRAPAAALEHALGVLPRDLINDLAHEAPAAAAAFAAPMLSEDALNAVVAAAPEDFLVRWHGNLCWARLELPLIPMLAERDPEQTLLEAGARMLREQMMSVVLANPREALPAFVAGAIVLSSDEADRLMAALRKAVVAAAMEDDGRCPTEEMQDRLCAMNILGAVEEYARDPREFPTEARARVREAARWDPEAALRVATRWLTNADVDEIAPLAPAAALKHAADWMSGQVIDACAQAEPLVALAYSPEYLSYDSFRRAEQDAARLLESGEPIPDELARAFDVSRAPVPRLAAGPGM